VDTPTTNILSICSGVGGIELGISAVLPGARTVCYVEREISACQILVARIRDGSLDDAPIWGGDLAAFDPGPWAGRIHLIAGGVPCTPFSVAGLQRGEDDERNLFPEVVRIAAGLGYPDIFLENVGAASRYYYDAIRPQLRAMGYAVAETLVTAAEVGAPHKRERLFILAHAERRAAERHRYEVAGTTGQTESETQQRQRLRADVRDGRDQLADASDTRLQGVLPSRQDERPSRPSYVPLFPPGPTDRDGWTYLLNEMPEVEPTICSVANGVPSGLDRVLRALGNAVVPSVAGTAWLLLSNELAQRREEMK
jgi:DNA (cytosine-5)-methyltransferase 1